MRNYDRYNTSSVISTRLSEKPPRPRQSRSPAYPEENRGWFASKKDQLIPHSLHKEPSNRDLPKSIERIPSTEDNYVHRSEPEPSIHTDSSSEPTHEDNSLHEPNLDVPNLAAWLMDTSKPDVTSSHPFSMPATAYRPTREVPALSGQRVKPEDDILMQWRLRRKMEQARLTSGPGTNTFHAYSAYHPVPSPYNDSRKFLSDHLCDTSTTKRSFWSVQPDPRIGLCHHCHGSFTRDMGIQVGTCQPTASKSTFCEVLTQTESDMLLPEPVSSKDAATSTETVADRTLAMCTKSTSTRTGRRSVGTTVHPSLQDATVQTPRQLVHPGAPSDCSPPQINSNQQQKVPTRISAIGAPAQLLHSVFGVTMESPSKKPPMFDPQPFGDVDEESVQTTEADSWQWHSRTVTPEPVDSHVSSEQFLGPAPKEPETGEGNQPETRSSAVSHQSFVQPNSLPSDAVSGAHSAYNGPLNESIIRYLEQTAHESQSNLSWLSDPIVKDLHQRRNLCLLEMKLLIEEIYKHELAVLDIARDSTLQVNINN